jgi:anthranilate synthase/aminodeoxychorismate synthase-like glutamine amidotransferase
MIMVIDNYDSFVYNLVQYLGELGETVIVVRNDHVNIDRVMCDPPDAIVVSPGPGIPRNAGKSCDVITACAGRIPILGVCLGHQAIADVFGGTVIRAKNVVHGKVSMVHHDGSALFEGIENPFVATRYHSLVVEKKTLPSCLQITAWTDDGTIMGVRHVIYPVEGVQFHPESVLTICGKRLINNFLKGAVCEYHPVQ